MPTDLDDSLTSVWLYPTSTARSMHWFPQDGEPSGCRRYILRLRELMYSGDPNTAELCAKCKAAEAKVNS
jgi:hypothetical protein